MVGDANENGALGSGNALSLLAALNADVATVEDEKVKPFGIIDSYVPRWSAQIENTNNYETPYFSANETIIYKSKSGTLTLLEIRNLIFFGFVCIITFK